MTSPLSSRFLAEDCPLPIMKERLTGENKFNLMLYIH